MSLHFVAFDSAMFYGLIIWECVCICVWEWHTPSLIFENELGSKKVPDPCLVPVSPGLRRDEDTENLKVVELLDDCQSSDAIKTYILLVLTTEK